MQVGSIGLIKAVDRFDIDRGVDISSYAVPTIVGEIRRHFRDKAWAMHVPRRLKELERQALPTSSISSRTSSAVRRRSLSSHMRHGVEEEDVIDALDSTNAYSTRSLQAPFEDGGDDYLADKLGHGGRRVRRGRGRTRSSRPGSRGWTSASAGSWSSGSTRR